VIVRHHNNGFVYSEQEKELMIEDVIACREFGAHGVVVGSLT
jgi:copper homeostasis protein CutC